MKKIFYSLATATLPILAGVTPVFAQEDYLGRVVGETGLSSAPLPELIGSLIYTFLGLLGVIFLVLVIYAGFLWMTAGGDEGKVQKAKDYMIRAVIGLVIILASYGIASFVMNTLVDSGLSV